jgi:predicted aminopeptidase
LKALAGTLSWATIMLTQLAACASPAYYAQAVSGHYSLMAKREDVQKLMLDPQTNEELAARLERSQAIRTFAIDSLDLPDGGSYRQYVTTGRAAVSWNVIAAPKFSLTPKKWCFPVSGCVPYRAYFSNESARRFASRLTDRGYDVSVSAVTAYSTLGWFNDPLLDTMFAYGDADLAGVMIHEMAHQKIYVPGDTAFNESFASFVETIGVERWLESNGQSREWERWQKRRQATAQFADYLAGYRSRLESLYRQPIPEEQMRRRKAQIFADIRANYPVMVESIWNGHDYFAGWFRKDLNNARLVLFDSYHGGECAFRKLYDQAEQRMHEFMILAAQKADLSKSKRQAWLHQPCNVIAPEHKL